MSKNSVKGMALKINIVIIRTMDNQIELNMLQLFLRVAHV